MACIVCCPLARCRPEVGELGHCELAGAARGGENAMTWVDIEEAEDLAVALGRGTDGCWGLWTEDLPRYQGCSLQVLQVRGQSGFRGRLGVLLSF